MVSMAFVGVFGKIAYKATDAANNDFSENVGYTTANVTTDSVASAAILSFTTGLNALTTSTYDSTKITYEIPLDHAWEG